MNYKSIRPFLKILYPVSYLWEVIYRLRRFFYDVGYFRQNTFKVPIISIGNLSLGGTGKTPFTLWVGKYLNERNKRVMVLSRGYRGNLEQGSGIIKSDNILSYNPYEYGDEALVICRNLKRSTVVVGKNRSENLKYYFDQITPDIVLLDDGHQHLKINRDLNFVLFDATLDIEQYKAPPLGYLREGLTALKDADAIIIGRADLVDDSKLSQLESLLRKHCLVDIPFAKMRYIPRSINNISYKKVMNSADMNEKRVMVVTGIASPDSFSRLIENMGAEVVSEYFYPDHHFYTSNEISDLVKLAERENLYLLTTEKDIVKIRKVSQSQKILYVHIELDFLEGENEIMSLIDSVTL